MRIFLLQVLPSAAENLMRYIPLAAGRKEIVVIPSFRYPVCKFLPCISSSQYFCFLPFDTVMLPVVTVLDRMTGSPIISTLCRRIVFE